MTQSVVVVQGTPVSDPYGGSTTPTNTGFANAIGASSAAQQSATPTAFAYTPPTSNPAGGGEKQETRCRDPIFALLLYANVAAIIGVAVIYGPAALDATTTSGAEDPNVYTGYVYASIICAVISFFVSAGGVLVMMCIPETLIKVALIFTVIMAGVMMIMAFLSGAIFAGIMGAVFFLFSLCYARAVWSRIPFATINLVTAITAIKSNWGIVFYAYFFTIVAGLWSICWSVALIGVFDQTYECDANNVCTNPSYGLLFLLFLSYFFTHQVLQGSIHTTVAGMTGNWWFEPSEANHCCSSAINNAFIRTMTTSFGSICFGSLLVAILQALRMLCNAAQANDDGGCCVCILECILSCLASMMEYFNKWAFIYVGLYGYPYIQAGKQVFTLFKNRGWEAIIADDLIENVLFMVSLVVGGIVGCIAIVIERTSDLFEQAGGNSIGIAFLLGFIIGLVICSIALSTIGSAVNAIIVLFAEAPADFARNYPDLSRKMTQIWSEIYPGSV